MGYKIQNTYGDVIDVKDEHTPIIDKYFEEDNHAAIDDFNDPQHIPSNTVKVTKDSQIKEYDVRSKEYKDLYKSGHLTNYDAKTNTYIGTPLKGVTVTAEAPQWLKYKRQHEKDYTPQQFASEYLPKWHREDVNNLQGSTLDKYNKEINDRVAENILNHRPKPFKQYKNSNISIEKTDQAGNLEWYNSFTDKEREIIQNSKHADQFLPAQRAKDINTSDNYTNMSEMVQGTPDKGRLFPNAENSIEDYVNPLLWIGDMAKGIGNVPKDIEEGNYGKAALSLATPLAFGAMSGLGAKGAKTIEKNVVKGLSKEEGKLAINVENNLSAEELIKKHDLDFDKFKNIENVNDRLKNGMSFDDYVKIKDYHFENLTKKLNAAMAEKVKRDNHQEFLKGLEDMNKHIESGKALDMSKINEFTKLVDNSIENGTVADIGKTLGEIKKESNTWANKVVDHISNISGIDDAQRNGLKLFANNYNEQLAKGNLVKEIKPKLDLDYLIKKSLGVNLDEHFTKTELDIIKNSPNQLYNKLFPIETFEDESAFYNNFHNEIKTIESSPIVNSYKNKPRLGKNTVEVLNYYKQRLDLKTPLKISNGDDGSLKLAKNQYNRHLDKLSDYEQEINKVRERLSQSFEKINIEGKNKTISKTGKLLDKDFFSRLNAVGIPYFLYLQNQTKEQK